MWINVNDSQTFTNKPKSPVNLPWGDNNLNILVHALRDSYKDCLWLYVCMHL